MAIFCCKFFSTVRIDYLKVYRSSQSSCKRDFTCDLTHLCVVESSNITRGNSLKSYFLTASYVPTFVDPLQTPTVVLLESNHM